MISLLGTGILLSTALLVIIPEGVDTLYSTSASNARVEVGLSLLFGFFFMFILDKLPTLSTARSFLPVSIDMSTFRASATAPAPGPSSPTSSPSHNDSTHSTSVGLIIHAVADGIALGASIATRNSALEALVFLAIMVHKAPAAFGLSAVLQASTTHARTKRILGMFALAAPLGAVVTYAVISLLGASDLGLIEWWTGILLLVSGGTFLYVAVHVMQEGAVISNPIELAVSVAGMALPLMTLLIKDD